MPQSFVTLWTVERCRWLERVGDRGPLEVVFGGDHLSLPSLDAVTVGDVIYPVLVKQGGLYVVSRLQVEEFVTPDLYTSSHLGITRQGAGMWDGLFTELKRSRPDAGHRIPTTCCDRAAIGRQGSEIRFDRMLPSDALGRIRLGPKPGKELPLKGVEDGRMKSNLSLHGHVRRLSAESASMFEELFR